MTKTIRVSDVTHKRLCKYGKFGETMDIVLCRILDKSEIKKHKKT